MGIDPATRRVRSGHAGPHLAHLVAETTIGEPYVVLVLLVIFMITAPILMRDAIKLNLPKITSASDKTSSTMGVAITKAGQILLNGQLITDDGLRATVQEELKKNVAVQAIISADIDARHGDVIHAIDVIKSAGLEKFAIQVERENK